MWGLEGVRRAAVIPISRTSASPLRIAAQVQPAVQPVRDEGAVYLGRVSPFCSVHDAPFVRVVRGSEASAERRRREEEERRWAEA